MLNIITGRTGSGKTRYIRNLACQLAENASSKAVIIVPEQFSFETERGMLELLGNEKVNNVEILSFSRLSERLLPQYGKTQKRTADDGIRAVLMSRAIETLEEKLTVYNRYKKHPALIGEILDFYREIRKCKITNEQLSEFSNLVKKSSFSTKLSELSLIFDCYDALLSQNFNDDCASLDLLCDLLQDVDYFKGKTVFLDAFSGFSAQEYAVIGEILRQSDNVYVTFCCDTAKNNDRYELFYNTQTEIKKLKSVANKVNVKIASEKVLHSQKEYKKDELNFLEENVFASNNVTFEDNADAITVIPCRTKSDECDVIASEIKKLVRTENLRYRDIAVIVRNEGDYKKSLASSFRKYEIDCFHDNRQPVDTQPLIVFIKCLSQMLIRGFESETVLRFLKTQLYGFTVEDIALLEDYCLMWKCQPSSWRDNWTQNPKGYGEDFDENSQKTLEKINELRAKIVGPVLSLKNKIKDADGETISKEIFAFLIKTNIDENLKQLTAELYENGEVDLSLEQGRIWKILTEILDGLYFALGSSKVSLERYFELFDILVASKDIGQIPNGIDEVIIGGADRIRASAPKVVFLAGVNTGIFPGESSSGVLFNDFERCELINNGLEIVSNLEYNSVSENFIAYRAITLATEKIYLTYCAMSNSSSLTPSEMVDEVLKLFPKCNVINDYSKINKVESRNSAFSVMAGELVNGSVLGETIKDYFKNNNGEGEIEKLNKANKKDFAIENQELATEFFGKNMYISASRIENFYNCPFSYFCRYGLKAQPRKEAEVDVRLSGTLIHYTLEMFLKNNPKASLNTLSKDEIKQKINSIVDEYINEKMGGYENKAKSFIRTVVLMKESAFKVVMHLVLEFSKSKFVPADFELRINNDGQIPPYSIELDNGGNVKIVGSIDRVDTYTTDDNTFVRVIDYKTGGKEFKLGEVFSGLNMQMLIYLFAIWQNGGDYYKNVTPAGVLYFQAKNPRVSSKKITRESNENSAQLESLKELKMHGMVLNNVDVVNAMEDGCDGVFIPAHLDKNGALSGNVISLKALSNLKDRVNKSIKEMAEELQNGYIPAFPIKDGCIYCDYSDVCKREENDAIKEIEVPNFKDSIELLKGGDEDGTNLD